MDFTDVTDLDELNQAVADANTAAEGFRARIAKGENLTAEEMAELQGHFDTRDAARAQIESVNAAQAEQAQAQADLAGRFEDADAPADAPADATVTDIAPPADAPAADAPAAEGGDSLAASLSALAEAIASGALTASTSSTTTRPRVPRPAVPQAERAAADLEVAITAAGEAHGFAVGQDLTLGQVGEMAIRKFGSMPVPQGNGRSEDLKFSPLATVTMEHPEELQITEGKNEQDVFAFALDQSRLKTDLGEGSLLAAGGWCAPSEQLYDLCVTGESLDGMWSSPEVQAKRGGIKYTSGPDFATLFANIGFHQTEAQAIAGTAKGCYEVPCPSFVEARLEVEGICIKVPILTQAAYPELVNRIMSGALVVHAHKLNAFKLAKVEAASTAKGATDLGSSAETTLRAFELRAAYMRQIYRMSFGETLEAVLPVFVRAIFKADLRLRMGNDPVNVVTDATVDAHLRSIDINPQWVYDWQGLADSMDLPATFKGLLYPAGTFLTLTNDIINLSTVYDAASLNVNTYTGLFSEEGVAVAKMCAISEVITFPVCSNGTVGAAEFTCTAP